ncbi:hypothetical protein EXN66_Car018521 [Channa argus]|uniref:Uncharacterized protein n=1 Tax=Channa argus TaxID=215402 RepID=A0A6G1QKK0_CHAAH|nr:hypothetical protein EXN66_Car018521 [Channa argus]
MNAVIEAAQAQLSGKSGTLEQDLEIRKRLTTIDYTFSQQIPDALQDKNEIDISAVVAGAGEKQICRVNQGEIN